MHCTQCGKPIDNDAKFCPHCGARNAALAPPPSASQAAAPPPSSPPAFTPGDARTAAGAAAGAGASADFGRAASDAAAQASAAFERVDAKGLVARVKAILLSPRSEWQVIEAERKPAADIWVGHVAPLAALSVICGAIGMMAIGISVPLLGTLRSGPLVALGSAVLQFVMTFVAVFVVAWIVNALAPRFGGQKDTLRSLKVVAYASTAAWVAGVLTLIPMLGIIAMLISLYTFYLLYLGLPVLMRSPPEKALGYTVVVVICSIVVLVLVGLVVQGAGAALGLHTPGLAGSQISRSNADDATATVLSNMFGGKSDADKARVKDAMTALTQMGKDVEAAEKQARATGQDPNAAAANAVDLNKALTAAGAVVAGGKDVKPVDFHALKELLPPTIDGMAQRDSEGQNGEAVGMKGSSASARYGSGNGGPELRVEIADLGSLAGLAGLASKFNANVEKETSTGYERTRTVDGRIMHERYDRSAKSGEFGVMVGNRFLVTARGDNVGEPVLVAAVKSIDIDKLATLAN